ncbi:MAG: AlbA family DNA-binding domain-containing protein [Candidatus Scalindua sp.]
MIQKNLSELTIDDIHLLLENEVREGRALEYKQELPDNTDRKKISFLAEISALANTVGGDLIFGISDEKGVPSAIPGVKIKNLDQELLRLDNIIRTGIEPRLASVSIREIKKGEDVYVVVIRVKRSWIAPHRVKFQDHSKFYARSSAGKYPFDVTELRNSFLLSDRISERIRSFRNNRINSLLGNEELPVSLASGGKLVVHIIPFLSFADPRPNITLGHDQGIDFRPIGAGGWNTKINLEGYLFYSAGRQKPCDAYTQLYRFGTLESVVVLDPDDDDKLVLPSRWYEEEIYKGCSSQLKSLSMLGIETPIYIFISLLEMQGYRLGVGPEFFGKPVELDRELILLPEGVVNDYGENLFNVLRPAFDVVWNAFGYEGSYNFDENGNWKYRT